MAVSLVSTGITFPDSTTQTSRASVLGPVQIGPNQAVDIGANVASTYTTSAWHVNNATGAVQGDANSVVHCGWSIYRYGAYYNTTTSGDAMLDGPADTSQTYVRQVYRSVS
jgi:hypothetical protein